MALVEMDFALGSGGSCPTDILNWTYIDKVASPIIASGTTPSWSYTFDFNTYKYYLSLSEFGTANPAFFDSDNILHKLELNTPIQYPFTITQSGNTITFTQPVNANSAVYIYRFTE